MAALGALAAEYFVEGRADLRVAALDVDPEARCQRRLRYVAGGAGDSPSPASSMTATCEAHWS